MFNYSSFSLEKVINSQFLCGTNSLCKVEFEMLCDLSESCLMLSHFLEEPIPRYPSDPQPCVSHVAMLLEKHQYLSVPNVATETSFSKVRSHGIFIFVLS